MFSLNTKISLEETMRYLTNPNRPNSLFNFFNEIDPNFENFFDRSANGAEKFGPAFDTQESEKSFVVSIDLPGIKEKDISVDVKDNYLTVSGERHYNEHKDFKKSDSRYHYRFGKFERSFRLPNTVNSEKIEANFEDGVLHLLLPKTASASGQSIEVQSGKGGFFNQLLGSKKD